MYPIPWAPEFRFWDIRVFGFPENKKPGPKTCHQIVYQRCGSNTDHSGPKIVPASGQKSKPLLTQRISPTVFLPKHFGVIDPRAGRLCSQRLLHCPRLERRQGKAGGGTASAGSNEREPTQRVGLAPGTVRRRCREAPDPKPDSIRWWYTAKGVTTRVAPKAPLPFAIHHPRNCVPGRPQFGFR